MTEIKFDFDEQKALCVTKYILSRGVTSGFEQIVSDADIEHLLWKCRPIVGGQYCIQYGRYNNHDYASFVSENLMKIKFERGDNFLDYLSESDIHCLDSAIERYKLSLKSVPVSYNEILSELDFSGDFEERLEIIQDNQATLDSMKA